MSELGENIEYEKIILKERPIGKFSPSQCLDLVKDIMKLSEVADNEFLVKTDLLSVDAYILTTFEETAFHGSLPIGGTPQVLGIGTVIYSKNPDFPVSSIVSGALGAQTISKSTGVFISKINPTDLIKKNHFLTLLSITCGFTAWVGLNNCINPPKKGETVVVSGCSGAVGNCFAQFAKLTGAKVIGVAGGKKKCDFLIEELKLDGFIDYKNDDICFYKIRKEEVNSIISIDICI